MVLRVDAIFIAFLHVGGLGTEGIQADAVIDDGLHRTGNHLLTIDGPELDASLETGRAFRPFANEPTA